MCWLDPAWHTVKVCRAAWSVLSKWSSIGNGCQIRNIYSAALLVRVYSGRPYLMPYRSCVVLFSVDWILKMLSCYTRLSKDTV